jgi:hypothetical protein
VFERRVGRKKSQNYILCVVRERNTHAHTRHICIVFGTFEEENSELQIYIFTVTSSEKKKGRYIQSTLEPGKPRHIVVGVHIKNY